MIKLTRTKISVTDGPNKGASANVTAASSRIGGDGDADIRLYGVSEAATIQRDWLTPFLGPKLIRENGESQRLGRIGEFDLDGSTIEARTTKPGVGPVLAGLTAAGLLAMVYFSSFGDWSRVSAARAAGSVNVSAARVTPPVNMVLTAFRQRIAAVGLDTRVNVRQERNEPTIIAEGVISTDQKKDWRQALAWFQTNAAEHYFLFDAVKAENRTIVLPFQTVQVIGPPSNILRIDDGQEFTLGDELPGGWRIQSISSAGAVLMRDGDVVHLEM